MFYKMHVNNKNYLKDLIVSYLSHQASEKEQRELANWIGQSDENKTLFFEFKRIWELTSQSGGLGRFDKIKNDEWNKLLEKLEVNNKARRIISPPLLHKIIRIAAVFLLLISLGVSYAWMVTNRKLHHLENLEIAHQIVVPLGGKSEVVLPDGSIVILNADSKLLYSGTYGISDRNVSLEGEGYFDIKTNPETPFVVKVANMDIQALGTIFNVKAYPGEDEIITTLVEGVVRIIGERIDFTLEPSQKLSYIKGKHTASIQDAKKSGHEEDMSSPKSKDTVAEVIPLPVVKLTRNVSINEVTSWKDGIFIFKAEKLNNLAVLLERKFDVSVNIESEELKNHMFSGTFHKETLEQILDVINMSAPIKYQIVEGVVSIQLDEKRRHVFDRISQI